jgi:hypothetical protein
LLLAAAPAQGAAPAAQASATAVRLTVGGTPTDSGTFAVSHDGISSSARGNNRPQVTVLGGQSLISLGTLAQDATAYVEEHQGASAACAGLAGDGASLLAVGDGSCLAGGNNLQVSAATLDLSGLRLVSGTVLQGLDQQLQTVLQPVLAQVLPPLQTGLQTALTQLGDPEVVLDLGALQSSCRATVGSAAGDASLLDSAAYVTVAGQRVDLLSLPAHPAPNTKLATNLDQVVKLVLDDVRSELTTALAGALVPLGAAIDQAAVVDSVMTNLSAQLAPLEQNVLDGTLNRQVRPTADTIEVTALDLRVLPVLAQYGVDLFHLEVGMSQCGPSSRLAQAPPSPPTRSFTPRVPTSVPAGAAAADSAVVGPWGLVALLVLATGGGVAVVRRVSRR